MGRSPTPNPAGSSQSTPTTAALGSPSRIFSSDSRKAVPVIERLSRVALLGSAWVLYLLFGLSIFSIGIMLERWIFFYVRRDDTDKMADDLVARLRDGDLRGADQLLGRSKSIEAAVVRPALKWLDGGPGAVEEALEGEMRK